MRWRSVDPWIKWMAAALLLTGLLACEGAFVEPAAYDYILDDFEAAWKRVDEVYPYLDYKGIEWRLRRFGGTNIEVLSAGWPGGIPAIKNPDGEFMWDSTPVIHYLEGLFPEPSILPPDPVQRFLCYLLEDAADEWFYRVAVGSRWFFEENKKHAAFELARDATYEGSLTCEDGRVCCAGSEPSLQWMTNSWTRLSRTRG